MTGEVRREESEKDEDLRQVASDVPDALMPNLKWPTFHESFSGRELFIRSETPRLAREAREQQPQ